MLRSSHLSGQNAAYIEGLYENYLEDPSSVPEMWRSYFDTLPMLDGTIGPDTPHSTVVQHFERLGRNRLKAPQKKSPRKFPMNMKHAKCACKISLPLIAIADTKKPI